MVALRILDTLRARRLAAQVDQLRIDVGIECRGVSDEPSDTNENWVAPVLAWLLDSAGNPALREAYSGCTSAACHPLGPFTTLN
jgi:hypothetical protein